MIHMIGATPVAGEVKDLAVVAEERDVAVAAVIALNRRLDALEAALGGDRLAIKQEFAKGFDPDAVAARFVAALLPHVPAPSQVTTNPWASPRLWALVAALASHGAISLRSLSPAVTCVGAICATAVAVVYIWSSRAPAPRASGEGK